MSSKSTGKSSATPFENERLPLFNWVRERTAGVLLHPTSFPGDQGIGVLDGAVDAWLDFLVAAGIRQWQVCPLGPTGYGDSPYQCFSAFAGNPYLIDLRALVGHGLLSDADLAPLRELPRDRVDFGWLYSTKWPLLFKAFANFKQLGTQAAPYGSFAAFRQQHRSWLDPFALYLGLKDFHHPRPWWEWPANVRFFDKASSTVLNDAVLERAEAHAFFQYLFFGQWDLVRAKAKARNIEIIGDAPIFVSRDSADVWANPQLFQLDLKSGKPLAVAGCPPDYFTADGQLWGNPLYDWEKHRASGYAWWLERLRVNFLVCDILRIDHFRGFDTYWSIPADAPTARTGEWKQGPGLDFFRAVKRALPDCKLIAEDLGELLPSVHVLREATGLPGMAILQFAFGGEATNTYLPHHHAQNLAVYPGTHDNDTTLGWYRTADEKTRDHVRRYLRVSGQEIGWDFIRTSYHSPARLALVPLQDLMSLDSHARFNTPGKGDGNWQWRYRPEQLQRLLRDAAPYLKDLAVLTGR
ncbi:4-alpha-glucanotransferase [Nibricoccus sp. IMCC34717]|uniref:4-alpha-glucanotransferase n=1 Tax=Nibricoccus sp. IMCC34717 TaxID=3034021 RepID=UPI00384C74F2